MLSRFFAALCIALIGLTAKAQADDGVFIPSFWEPKDRLERPDTSSIRAIRFLTDDDYPPFNFTAPDGQLAGFNVELARQICEELKIACTIQARRWDTLLDALLHQKTGDAAVASLAITAKARNEMEFTHSIYRTPARFIARKGLTVTDPTPATLAQKTIAVVRNTAHSAFLTDFFPSVIQSQFADLAEAQAALLTSKVDLIFGDGIALSLWRNGSASGACCMLVGGPYLESHYFGEGVGIAVRKDREGLQLRLALDYALARLARNGTYAALYLKYFPSGLY